MHIAHELTPELAAHLQHLALGHVWREYPNKISHLLNGPEDIKAPHELYPLFWGSFDWHSCVHAHWLLARLAIRFPTLASSVRTRSHFESRWTDAAVAGECAQLLRPLNQGFERPYGWGWLLLLAAELEHAPAPWSEWGQMLAPLTRAIEQRMLDFLPRATYPVRVGTHASSAFSLALASEYALRCGREELLVLIRETALRWFGHDRDYRPMEPSGEDFLSPTLVTVELMRRALPLHHFRDWLDACLPRLEATEPAELFHPAHVSDRSDGKIAHLDGLNLSRVWCWRGIASVLPADDQRLPVIQWSINAHLDSSLPHVAGDYMGEHWLASFALLALDEVFNPDVQR